MTVVKRESQNRNRPTGPGETMKKLVLALATVSVLLPAVSAAAPNILVIIADDLGTESLASYGFGESTAVTPTLDRLASEGIRFERFWSQHVCSPTRAAVMTGRYAFRTGVRSAIPAQWAAMEAPTPTSPAHATTELVYTPAGLVGAGNESLSARPPPPPNRRPRGPSTDEIMLPRLLQTAPEPYATAAVGKWHLSDLLNGQLDHPNDSGFDYYSGVLFGGPSSYFAWRHLENGRLRAESGYYDAHITDDAIRWIGEQSDEPWFLWMSYSNPHTPVHLPLRELLRSPARDLPPNFDTEENNRAYFFAQVEAMDTLIGRLLDSIPDEVMQNTYVIFFGDNGTVEWDDPPPPRDRDRVKGTVYQGGIEVPLIVTGPGIAAGRVERPLAHAVDLFATILELAEVDIDAALPGDLAIDSVSIADHFHEENLPSRRSWVLSEGTLGAVVGTAIRDERYKLVVINEREEFYDLVNDPHELRPLSVPDLTGAARTSYETLTERLRALASE